MPRAKLACASPPVLPAAQSATDLCALETMRACQLCQCLACCLDFEMRARAAKLLNNWPLSEHSRLWGASVLVMEQSADRLPELAASSRGDGQTIRDQR